MQAITININGIDHPAKFTILAYHRHKRRMDSGAATTEEVFSTVWESIIAGYQLEAAGSTKNPFKTYDDFCDSLTMIQMQEVTDAYILLIKTYLPTPSQAEGEGEETGNDKAPSA